MIARKTSSRWALNKREHEIHIAYEAGIYIIAYESKHDATKQTRSLSTISGAGMDSRAWRLKLPSGITWFELDRKDVLDVKLQLLKENGAQVDTK